MSKQHETRSGSPPIVQTRSGSRSSATIFLCPGISCGCNGFDTALLFACWCKTTRFSSIYTCVHGDETGSATTHKFVSSPSGLEDHRIAFHMPSHFLLFVLVGLAHGFASWPIKYTYSPDSLPIIQIRLAPPTKALPEVNAAIGKLASERTHFEVDSMRELERAYEINLKGAAVKIHAAVDRLMAPFEQSHFNRQQQQRTTGSPATALLQTSSSANVKLGGEGLRARINLLPLPAVPIGVEAKMEQMESVRHAHQANIFQQAISEMEGLTSMFVSEAEAQITRSANALLRAMEPVMIRKLHKRIPMRMRAAGFKELMQQNPLPSGLQLTTNLRVMASEEPFPTVELLAEDLERRRDASEALINKRILELELKLLQSENAILSDALQARVASIVSRWA